MPVTPAAQIKKLFEPVESEELSRFFNLVMGMPESELRRAAALGTTPPALYKAANVITDIEGRSRALIRLISLFEADERVLDEAIIATDQITDPVDRLNTLISLVGTIPASNVKFLSAVKNCYDTAKLLPTLESAINYNVLISKLVIKKTTGLDVLDDAFDSNSFGRSPILQQERPDNPAKEKALDDLEREMLMLLGSRAPMGTASLAPSNKEKDEGNVSLPADEKSPLWNAVLEAEGVAEADRAELIKKFQIEIARALRPKWQGRLERGGTLATLTAPQFLKSVHAADIGPDGTVHNEVIRAIDPELMQTVELYISHRLKRGRDLGDAEGLKFVLTRPPRRKLRKPPDTQPKP